MPYNITTDQLLYADLTAIANGTLSLLLVNSAGGTVTIDSTGANAPTSYSFALTSNGTIIGIAAVYGNNELTPKGTLYRATVTNPTGNIAWGPTTWIVGPAMPYSNVLYPDVAVLPLFSISSGDLPTDVAYLDITQVWTTLAQTFNSPVVINTTLAVGSPQVSGMSTGDISVQRSATTGALYLGTDGSAFVFRNVAASLQFQPNVPGNVTGTVAGAGTLGSNAIPFASIYLGAAATNNVQLIGTATAARVATLPDAGGTVTELNIANTFTGAQTISLSTAIDGLHIFPTAGNTFSGLQVKNIAGTLMVDMNPDSNVLLKVLDSSSNGIFTMTAQGAPIYLCQGSGAAAGIPLEVRGSSPQTVDLIKFTDSSLSRLLGITQLGLLEIGSRNALTALMAGFPHASFYTSTQEVTIRNTVVETSIFVGTQTIPAKWMVPGRQIRIRAKGLGTTTAVPPTAQQVRVKMGATVIASLPAAATGGFNASPATLIDLDIVLTCRSATSTGFVMCNGDLTVGAGALSFFRIADAAAAVDFTVSQTLDVMWTWGTANILNSITFTNVQITLE